MNCINCKTEYPENSVGFYTDRGFLCMACENVEIDTFTVKYPGITDCIFKYKSDAEQFIEIDIEEDDSKYEDYTIIEGKMKAMEYFNLEEWDG